MAANCTRCKDTGTARWGGFYEHRGATILCDCPAGDRARWTPEQHEAHRLAITAEKNAARAARRAAREAQA